MMRVVCLASAFSFLPFLHAAVLSIEDFGAVAAPAGASDANRDAINAAFVAAQDGDTVLVPAGKEYVALGGITITSKIGITFQIDGTLAAEPNWKIWPLDEKKKHALDLVTISECSRFVLTGSGLINGNGIGWWDAFVLQEFKGSRLRLFETELSSDMIFERVTLQNSPRFNLHFEQCARVTLRYITIVTDRTKQRELKSHLALRRAEEGGLGWALEQPHLKEAIIAAQYRDVYKGRSVLDYLFDEVVKVLPSWILEPEDLNTDGIDPGGIDFHIHDCNILNDDDSIAVKPCDGKKFKEYKPGKPGFTDCSQNMLIENTVLTGFGASIGSVTPKPDIHCVRNITFRNISMPNTGKGIYIKSNPGCGKDTNIYGELVDKTSIIEDITYEDISIDKPFWWSVFIGPQQQQEPGSALGDKCALQYPFFGSQCPTQGCATFKDITLRNVHIKDPVLSPGFILGNSTNPMQNITFDNVTVDFAGMLSARGRFPNGRKFVCTDAEVNSVHGTSLAPTCESSVGLSV